MLALVVMLVGGEKTVFYERKSATNQQPYRHRTKNGPIL